ncbi:MAG: hypothetical protein ACKV0T_25300 [Planctomycetales bacterium]
MHLLELLPIDWLASVSILADQASDSTWLDKILREKSLFVYAFLVLIILVPSLANTWYKMRVKEWETSLKLAMLERGMSAEEIAEVLSAGSAKRCSRPEDSVLKAPSVEATGPV